MVSDPGLFFRVSTVITLTGGTVFLMWLGEQITQRGIGNGTSLIIMSGIVAQLPSALAGTLELGRQGALSTGLILIVLVMAIAVITFIVFMERAQRRLLIQYPKRQVGNRMFEGQSSHLPLKLNTSGVIPPIFASSLLLLPTTVANFVSGQGPGWLTAITTQLSHGRPLFLLLYVGLIVFFAFFYTAIVFNPTETADNLKKHGGFIPGIRPGERTAEYIDYVLSRITVLGAIYLAIVCLIPEILISYASVPFYFGGTSLLMRQMMQAKDVLFWLLLGGFVWVIGDLFQQYAAKYVGISRGIPLSNTNQLWGLAWGILVFGELHGRGSLLYAQVIAGSLLMAAGAGAIALSSVTHKEHGRWHEAAHREGERYGVPADYVQAGLAGSESNSTASGVSSRTWRDWSIIVIATAVFVGAAALSRVPSMALNWSAISVLSALLLILLAACGTALWKVTRFS